MLPDVALLPSCLEPLFEADWDCNPAKQNSSSSSIEKVIQGFTK
jgi:hypothetical protein